MELLNSRYIKMKLSVEYDFFVVHDK